MSLAMRRSKVMRQQFVGDPGFSLGGLLKGIAKTAVGFATGGPIGAIAGAASSLIGGGGAPKLPAVVQQFLPQQMPMPTVAPMVQQVAPSQGVQIGGSITIPGVGTITGGTGVGIQLPGSSGFGPGGTGIISGGSSTAPGACVPGMRGVRLNKTGYFLKSGQFIAPGTKCVRVRRRNPLNPRALSKAMGRVVSFKKAATAASRITIRERSCAKCK